MGELSFPFFMLVIMKTYILFLILISSAQAKLLDKVVAVFNDEIITLSDVSRVKKNLKARQGISRVIYPEKNYTLEELVDKELEIRTVREYFSTIGYTVNDDQVESMVSTIERQNGLQRKDLINYLSSEGITYQEYFELLRATKEHNDLVGSVIQPLVSITDQQVKNIFFRDFLKNKSVSIKYFLIAYSIDASLVKNPQEFLDSLKKYQSNGILDKKYSSTSEINIGDVKEDDLSKTVSNVLKNTDEGSLSEPIRQGQNYIVYFVKTKDLVESNLFLQAKPQIQAFLFQKESKKVFNVWIEREKEKHFIKKFL